MNLEIKEILIERAQVNTIRNINESVVNFMMFTLKQLDGIKSFIQPYVDEPVSNIINKLKVILLKIKRADTFAKTISALVLFVTFIVGFFAANIDISIAKDLFVKFGGKVASSVEYITSKIGYSTGAGIKMVIDAGETASTYVMLFFPKATQLVEWMLEGFKSKRIADKTFFQRLFGEASDDTDNDSIQKILEKAIKTIFYVLTATILGKIIFELVNEINPDLGDEIRKITRNMTVFSQQHL